MRLFEVPAALEPDVMCAWCAAPGGDSASFVTCVCDDQCMNFAE
jgi:hypothetical protein